MGNVNIILVRHGQTTSNLARTLTGTRDVNLTLEGIRQATLVGEVLKNEEISHIYISALKRTYQTAFEIAKEHVPKINLDDIVIRKTNLNEMCFGVAQGKNITDFENETGKKFDQGSGYPVGIEGQEEFSAFTKRYINAITEIAKESKEGETICIVGHGMGIRTFLRELNNVKITDFNKTTFFPNAGIAKVSYDLEKGKFEIIQDVYKKHLEENNI